MERIGGETQVLYADLRERLEAYEAMRSIASLPGEFTTKTVKGIRYHYFQTILPGGRTQIYIGPDNDTVSRLIEARSAATEGNLADSRMFQRLAAQITAGGVVPLPAEMARIINRLADSGVFRVGGVLVGTVAYQVLGTHLGVTWENAARMTQDIDLAGDNHIAIAVPALNADIPAVIESLQMGFFPVPRLSHTEPSTSWAIRGKTLRIDLLTPAHKVATTPVFIRRLNAAATPLKYLDYLIEKPIRAVMLAGTPCLVSVPQPARFALHKLILSQERDASSADKRRKDLVQATSLIALLQDERPGELDLARADLVKRGATWQKKLAAACTEARIEL